MAASHTLTFTVLPRGISQNADRLPVSVLVSPRLRGETKLGPYPDWLNWTERLKANGLTLTFACNGQTHSAAIDTTPLRPELWTALFNEETLVRSHQFQDYGDRRILTYSVRLALSVLKAVYQDAGVRLADLEQRGDDAQGERKVSRQGLLRDILGGLEVNWDEELGDRWRKQLGVVQKQSGLQTAAISPALLDDDGLIRTELLEKYFPHGTQQGQQFHQAVAAPFAVYHKMPVGKPIAEEPTDFDTVLDFHQALSSLNTYPAVQRALGLVFDFELPREFVALTTGAPKTLSVTSIAPGWEWAITPATAPLTTAYIHAFVGNKRFFFTAPRAFLPPTQPPQPPEPLGVLGLLVLDPGRFGLAQVDVDGGLHKAIMLAETLATTTFEKPVVAETDDGFDDAAALAALRSGGFSLFADARAIQLLNAFAQNKAFNIALESQQPPKRSFGTEDLVRGYALDVWDSRSNAWHSLHRRNGVYRIGEQTLITEDEEGFMQLAAAQPSKSNGNAPKDLYLHEALARWAGWSLSVDMPGKHLTRHADPDKAVPPEPGNPEYEPENPAVTPFDMTTAHTIVPKSLPMLRFGVRYRLRARAVDLAGNSLKLGDPLTDALSTFLALPARPEGVPYLRYEPVIAPVVVLRDVQAVTGFGSALNRIVIRTFNDDASKDGDPADLTANDRHIAPPRITIEMAERLGMLDDSSGKLNSSAAMWQLIRQRDKGEFNQTPQPVLVAGKEQVFPLEPADRLDALPYLPDVLARGAAFRNLPGTPEGSRGRAEPGVGVEATVPHTPLGDPNPRPGSATLIGFGGADDWQKRLPFRFALAEGDQAPTWDPAGRVLTARLAKGTMHTVLLSSYLASDDLKLMGVWQWLREYIERLTILLPQQQQLAPGVDVDAIAHLLQRSVEGGHWMVSPPRTLKLVHAVQQPLGHPAFTAITVQRAKDPYDKDPLQTQPEIEPTEETELAPVTAWRRLGSTDAYLLGGLKVHGASTAKVDVLATWSDPVDDEAAEPGEAAFAAPVDEVPLPRTTAGTLVAPGKDSRAVGYYAPEQDTICFVKRGDQLGSVKPGATIYADSAPRHQLGDTKHHVVTYTAVATSRYREYFPPDQNLDFTRVSQPVVVDVPASARPAAPRVQYVLPTFGWQRETSTNIKRSVRFGGGLRVYLERGWYSSGVGELLGVALWNWRSGTLDDAAREKWKNFITQWGQDPIWQTHGVFDYPSLGNFPDVLAAETGLSLEERTPLTPSNQPGRVDVAGFPVHFDAARKLWYCDLTLNLDDPSYSPFVRLALVRYQPNALPDAKLSRVVLADFVQLTPDRSAVVSADPYQPRRLRVTLSGVAPRGPAPALGEPHPSQPVHRPTQITVRVQQRQTGMDSDLAWEDLPASAAQVTADYAGQALGNADLALWTGTVQFTQSPEPGRYRLVIEEREYISASYTLVTKGQGRARRRIEQPSRLIYAEFVELDAALISGPAPGTGTEA